MEGVVVVQVGPVKAKLAGKVMLSDLNPPSGYRISGEGSGGVAGFANGGATVTLTPDGPAATLLHYVVDAQIGGKLAQLGGRLIDSTAKKARRRVLPGVRRGGRRRSNVGSSARGADGGGSSGALGCSGAAGAGSAAEPAATARTPETFFARLVAAVWRLLGLERAARSS
jgi:hypothetical protein